MQGLRSTLFPLLILWCTTGTSLFLSGQSPATTRSIPVFENGEAQLVDAFNNPNDWIRHDLWVETTFDSDGDGQLDRMHVSVTRPSQTESEGLKLPVVYVSSPYFAGTAGNEKGLFWEINHELGEMPPPRMHPEVQRRGTRPIISNSHIQEWVPRGYIVVHSSSPGTGLSQGSPTVGGSNESLAPRAVIEWLCGKENGFTEPVGGESVSAYWSTGKVGMTGTSYNGTLPIAAATTGVNGLEAIIPIAPNTSYYHYYRSHGLIRHPGGYAGEDIDVLYDFIHSGDEKNRPRNNLIVRDCVLLKGMDRITGDYNDFWAGRDYLNQLQSFKAALLMSHGFNDWNVMPEHSYRIYKAVQEKGVPARIYYHQAGHGGPPPFSMMNKWFTKYLHGIDNGVEKEPLAWIVREKDDKDNPTAYPDYPHPDAKHVPLFFSKGAPERGALTLQPILAQGTETLIDNYSFSGETLAKAENTAHRLIYISPPLSEEIHISGVPEITLNLAIDKPAANLSVWLVSLPWESGRRSSITDNIITRGWADPQNYRSLRKGEPLKTGQFYTLNFSLQPDDQIIRKGQQIGLMIFSSDRDFTLWPEPGTKLTVDLDKSKLLLPIVGGEKALQEAFTDKK